MSVQAMWSRFWVGFWGGVLGCSVLLCGLGEAQAACDPGYLSCSDGTCCPGSHPVCCTDGCCPSGTTCGAGSSCNVSGGGSGGDSCPSSKPIECGSGGCCSQSYPVCCANHCCRSGTQCTSAGCEAPNAGCPSGTYRCGATGCTPNGKVCCANVGLPTKYCDSGYVCKTDGCYASSGGSSSGSGSGGSCPSSHPIACSGSGCCSQDYPTCCGDRCCSASASCENGSCVSNSSSDYGSGSSGDWNDSNSGGSRGGATHPLQNMYCGCQSSQGFFSGSLTVWLLLLMLVVVFRPSLSKRWCRSLALLSWFGLSLTFGLLGCQERFAAGVHQVNQPLLKGQSGFNAEHQTNSSTRTKGLNSPILQERSKQKSLSQAKSLSVRVWSPKARPFAAFQTSLHRQTPSVPGVAKAAKQWGSSSMLRVTTQVNKLQVTPSP